MGNGTLVDVGEDLVTASLDKTIFVLDDDEAVRDSLQALLESIGHSVRTYSSGTQFLDDHGPRHDGCLLLDLTMAEMDGFEVLELLAARQASIPVIVMTGTPDRVMSDRAVRLGASAVLHKPLTDAVLIETIDLLIRRG